MAALVAVSGAPPTDAPDSLDAKIAALSKKLLADPGDKDLARELWRLHGERRQRRRDALDALATGLEACLDNRLPEAAADLRRAMACPSVVKLFSAELPPSVTKVLDAYGPKPKPKPPPKPPSAGPCPKCGDTGLADCRNCNGRGWGRRCTACSGRGCGRCNYTGEGACRACDGAGEVDCPKCVPQEKRSAPEPAPPPETTAIGADEIVQVRRVISMARFLRDGGLDLFSPRALVPSPGPPASQSSARVRPARALGTGR